MRSPLFINLTPDKTFQGKIVDSIEKARFAGSPIIAYGAFLSYLITFVIVLLVGLVALRILARSNGAEVEGVE